MCRIGPGPARQRWRVHRLVGRRLDPVALLGLLLLALFAIEVTVASRQSARRPGAAPRE